MDHIKDVKFIPKVKMLEKKTLKRQMFTIFTAPEADGLMGGGQHFGQQRGGGGGNSGGGGSTGGGGGGVSQPLRTALHTKV